MESQVQSFVRLRTQFDNVGDALITRELMRQIAARSDVWADASNCPAAFVAEVTAVPGNVRIVKRFGSAQLYVRLVLAALAGRRCFHFLLPGGLTGEKSRAAAMRAQVQTTVLGLLRHLGVTTCQVGASCTNLGPRYRGVIAARSRVLDAHYVRDSGTRAYLSTFGAHVDGIVPDLALGLYRLPHANDARRSWAALSFRLDGPRGRQTGRITALADAVARHQLAAGRCKVVSQVRRDDVPMRALAGELARRHPSLEVEFVPVDSIDACVRAYEDVHTLFSNRLHALLVAAYAGAVPVAVIDAQLDAKVSGLFDELGLADYVVTEDVVDIDAVAGLPVVDHQRMADRTGAIDRVFHRIFNRGTLNMYARTGAVDDGHTRRVGEEP